MGLCAILGGRNRVAQALFYGLVLGAAGLFAGMFVMLERRGTPEGVGRWRPVLEFCFFLIAGGAVVHGHYYYLSILILPLTLMLYDAFWGSRRGRAGRLVPSLLAYAALSPFIVPIALVARMAGGDPWMAYLSHGIYAYGDAILVALLFWKYATLLQRAPAAALAGLEAS
jgi:hypothetical protein